MARGDEVDYWADDSFARLDGGWVDISSVKGVEKTGIPMKWSDTRLSIVMGNGHTLQDQSRCSSRSIESIRR